MRILTFRKSSGVLAAFIENLLALGSATAVTRDLLAQGFEVFLPLLLASGVDHRDVAFFSENLLLRIAAKHFHEAG